MGVMRAVFFVSSLVSCGNGFAQSAVLNSTHEELYSEQTLAEGTLEDNWDDSDWNPITVLVNAREVYRAWRFYEERVKPAMCRQACTEQYGMRGSYKSFKICKRYVNGLIKHCRKTKKWCVCYGAPI